MHVLDMRYVWSVRYTKRMVQNPAQIQAKWGRDCFVTEAAK